MMPPASLPQRRILWRGSQRACSVGISNERAKRKADRYAGPCVIWPTAAMGKLLCCLPVGVC